MTLTGKGGLIKLIYSNILMILNHVVLYMNQKYVKWYLRMHALLRKNKFKLLSQNYISEYFIQTSKVNSDLTPPVPGCMTQISVFYITGI